MMLFPIISEKFFIFSKFDLEQFEKKIALVFRRLRLFYCYLNVIIKSRSRGRLKLKEKINFF